MNPMYFQEDHDWFACKAVMFSYVSRISVVVHAKPGPAALRLSSTYECKKFPQMKNNTKVINMNMLTMNQNLTEMVQIK